jgi:hypothetical protein
LHLVTTASRGGKILRAERGFHSNTKLADIIVDRCQGLLNDVQPGLLEGQLSPLVRNIVDSLLSEHGLANTAGQMRGHVLVSARDGFLGCCVDALAQPDDCLAETGRDIV